MIARHWKGIAKPELADAYEQHLLSETFPHLLQIKGFIKASILKRRLAAGIEFLIITQWDSLSSIKAFAGEDIEIAVIPQKVREMMVHYDDKAFHYEVAKEFDREN
jgi:heme-degrading monooxygenase HmoA